MASPVRCDHAAVERPPGDIRAVWQRQTGDLGRIFYKSNTGILSAPIMRRWRSTSGRFVGRFS